MEKSIESIWKEGFVDNEMLVVPKVNDLYNKKSENLIDKFHYLFDMNRKFIIGGAFLTLFVFSFIGVPLLGGFIALSLFLLLHIGKDGMKKLEQIDKNMSSYHYLKSFVEWKKEVVAVYSKTYTYYYPILFLAFAIQGRLTEDADVIINNLFDLSDTFLVFNTPISLVIGVMAVAGLLSYFAAAIYQKDLNIVYGQEFKKLDRLIEDMEALRN